MFGKYQDHPWWLACSAEKNAHTQIIHDVQGGCVVPLWQQQLQRLLCLHHPLQCLYISSALEACVAIMHAFHSACPSHNHPPPSPPSPHLLAPSFPVPAHVFCSETCVLPSSKPSTVPNHLIHSPFPHYPPLHPHLAAAAPASAVLAPTPPIPAIFRHATFMHALPLTHPKRIQCGPVQIIILALGPPPGPGGALQESLLPMQKILFTLSVPLVKTVPISPRYHLDMTGWTDAIYSQPW